MVIVVCRCKADHVTAEDLMGLGRFAPEPSDPRVSHDWSTKHNIDVEAAMLEYADEVET